MLGELQRNRNILDELVDCYKMFRFTGGNVPRGPWGLVAITSYVEHPFAADRIGTCEAEHYRVLAGEIMALGQTVATGKPRTLRQRWDVAATFAQAAGEVRGLGGNLEAGLTDVLNELAASPTFAERMQSVEMPGSDDHEPQR